MTETIYICMFEPEGQLRYDCSIEIEVFATYEEALKCARERIENDIENDDYVVDKEEYKEFKERGNMYVNVFYDYYENFEWYYSISIFQREVKF